MRVDRTVELKWENMLKGVTAQVGWLRAGPATQLERARALLPAVRSAEKETMIVANGFSCQEQIAQSTNRRAMHLADLLRLASHPRT